MTAGVETDHAKNLAAAVCDSLCRLPPGATLERLRQHVKQTGHTVRYSVTLITVYRPKEKP
jgi:hypothetical protein